MYKYLFGIILYGLFLLLMKDEFVMESNKKSQIKNMISSVSCYVMLLSKRKVV